MKISTSYKMKNCYAMLFIIAMMGCTEEEDSLNKEQIKGNYTLRAEIEQVKNTRTAVDSENHVIWIANDKIGVYGNEGSVNMPFGYNEISENKSIASFSGQLKNGEQPIATYYPYSAESSLVNDELSLTLPSKYD